MMTASALNIDIKFHEIDLFKNENRREFYRKVFTCYYKYIDFDSKYFILHGS